MKFECRSCNLIKRKFIRNLGVILHRMSSTFYFEYYFHSYLEFAVIRAHSNIQLMLLVDTPQQGRHLSSQSGAVAAGYHDGE